MPVRTPRVEYLPEGFAAIPLVLGDNIRAYRLLRRLEQDDLATAMRAYMHGWHRATVSEVERGRRNVTVWELVALVLILGASIEELLDPRGPGGRWGQLALAFPVQSNDGSPSWRAVAPSDVSALVCTHAADAEVERAPRRLNQIEAISEPPDHHDSEGSTP